MVRLCRKFRYVCWLFFAAAILSSPPQAPAQEKENAEFKLAVGLYKDGMYDLAVEQFRNFVNAYPSTSQGIEGRFYLGMTQMKLKRYDEARITFQNFALSYADHPKAPEAWMNVGEAFLALGNQKEAASAFERIRVFHPKSQIVPEALLKAGQVYKSLDDRDNAKKDFRAVIQEYPTSGSVLPARLALGEIYAQEGQTELAEREVRQVSQSDAAPPVKAGALLSLGRLQAATGLFDAAEATLSSLLTSYKKLPVAAAAAFELGKLAKSARAYPQALDYFKRVAADNGTEDSLQANALFETGLVYLLQQDYSDAQKVLIRFSSKYPRHPSYLKSLLLAGKSALSNNDPAGALDLAQKVLGIATDAGIKAQAQILAADANGHLHQYPEAIQYYTAFLDANGEHPEAPEVLAIIARIYSDELHDHRKAMTAYDQLTQRYSRSALLLDALEGVARCEEGLQDEEGAYRTYTGIQNRYPANDHYDSIDARIRFLELHTMKNRDAGIGKLAHLLGEVLTQQSKSQLSLKLGEIYFNELKDYEAAAQQFTVAIGGGLEPKDVSLARFLRARALHLQSDSDPALRAEAIAAYNEFLQQSPADARRDEASYYGYQLQCSGATPQGKVSLATAFMTQFPSSPFRGQILVDLGAASAEAHDSSGALKALRTFIAEYPQSPLLPRALFSSGLIWAGMHRADSAMKMWKQAATLPSANPYSAAALWYLSDLYRQRNDPASALPLWRRILNEFFYSSYARRVQELLPEALLAVGQYDEAVALRQKELEQEQVSVFLTPPNTNILYFLAAAYDQRGERQKAAEYYLKYLLRDRKGAFANKAFFALGSLARGSGQMENASAYFKQAGALGGAASADIADLLFQTEQYADAAKQYTQLGLDTDTLQRKQYYQARAILATFRLGRIAEGQKMAADFERVFGDTPARAEFLYEQASAYYRAQDYLHAKQLFEKVADDFGDTKSGPWGRFYVGKIAEVNNRLEEAAKTYEKILDKYPASDVLPRVLLSLGNMHFNAERFETSVRYYQQIMKFRDSAGDVLPYAMNNLIEAYESMKLYDEALKLTKDFIERFPNDESIIDKKIKLGTLYTHIGYYDQAVLHFQNLLGEAGSLLEAEIRYDIGEAYYNKGDYQQSILEFLKVPYLVSRQGKVNWTATAFYMAGQAYEKMSKFDEAVNMYQQIIERSGIDGTFKAAARKEVDRVKSIGKKGPN